MTHVLERGLIFNALINKIRRELVVELLLRSLAYFAVYLLFIIPILKANYFYVDDFGRALSGYLRWNSVGRPLASIFMEMLGFNRWAVDDLAPLPQLVAISCLAVASAWTSMRLRITFGFGLLSVAFIACNPFFLENLSYRYDSVTMSVAVALALVPLGLTAMFRGAALSILTVISLVLCLNFYQPAINVFIVFACFMALLDLEEFSATRVFRRLLPDLASFLVAMIAYKLELAFIGLEPYAAKHDQLIQLGHPQLGLHNVAQWLAFFTKNLLHTHQTELVAGGMAFGILVYLLQLARTKFGARTLTVSLVGAALLLLGMFGGVLGPILLLRNPVYAPRVLIGFGALSACLLSLIVLEFQHDRIGRTISSVVLAALLFGNFTISYAYGNMLIAQEAMHSAIADSIVNNAYDYSGQRPSTLVITGVVPRAYNVQREAKELPILNTLLPTLAKNFWTWDPLLELHGLPNFIEFSNHAALDAHLKKRLAACAFSRTGTTLYYNIYKAGQDIMIDFNKRCGNSVPEIAHNSSSDTKAALLLQPFVKVAQPAP